MHTRAGSTVLHFTLLVALVCVVISNARADDPCDSAETQQDIEQCLQRESKLADSTLSFQLRKLEATMKGMRMTGQWALMSKEQKAWRARADAM
ncbi:MAG: hypothetical protein H7X80_11790, partial [bacterium]|nr:hypothetical protein [Candidatus Kapabacteria bacterium]